MAAISEPISYMSDNDLASGGNSQYFSSVAKGYPDNRYPGQDFLFREAVVVYSPISNEMVQTTFWLNSINRYMHTNADAF